MLCRRSSSHDDFGESIGGADLVSFDVFDTLVTRPLSQPRAVFDLLAPAVGALLAEHRIELGADFRALREQAALQAAAEARSRGVEEYDLLSVYEILCDRLAAPRACAPELKRLEEELELTLHVPRRAGKALFDEALRRGKRVVLLSDNFLASSVVAEILRRCGYQNYSRLYVSSEYGLLKKTGRLYAHVRELERDPQRWVHFGDSWRADVELPARQGIHARHLPNISVLYASQPHVRELWKPEELEHSLGAALHHGVVSRKFYDQPRGTQQRARFDGSAYRLGYEGGGPLLLAFTRWIAESAQRDGLTDVYFLARDGHLPLRIYELLAASLPGAPRGHYLYASRRAYSVASLWSDADIAASLRLKARPMKLRDVLRGRFGVEPQAVSADSLRAAGLSSLEDEVELGNPVARERLEHFLRLERALILRQAASEREALLGYLRAQGLCDPQRRVGIVDIGHNATLQAALAKLTGRRDLKGYYLATFEQAREERAAGNDFSSYLLEFAPSKTSAHVYCQNVGLFEFLFLPALPSLARIEEQSPGTFRPVFVVGNEEKRFGVVEEVHRGVLDFCRDVAAASAGKPWLFDIPKEDALRSFGRFAEAPEREDAALLDGVSFLDAFGGARARYLIASPLLESGRATSYAEYEHASWWRAGARAAAGRAPKRRRLSSARAARWRRKLYKLWRDPARFVGDMKVARLIAKLRSFPSKWPGDSR